MNQDLTTRRRRWMTAAVAAAAAATAVCVAAAVSPAFAEAGRVAVFALDGDAPVMVAPLAPAPLSITPLPVTPSTPAPAVRVVAVVAVRPAPLPTAPSTHVPPSPPSSLRVADVPLRLPDEPDEFDERELDAYYDWRNDLFFRKFDMNGDGVANYMTARRTYKVWLDDFGTPVVVTVGSPVFYWLDRDGNGDFDTGRGEMWSDPDEDGVTGNERLYDTSHLETRPSRIPLWSAPTPPTP